MKKATIIGAGNVAWHLSQVLEAAGVEVTVVYRKSLPNWPVRVIDWPAFEQQAGPSGAVFVAVTDDQIGAVSGALPDRIKATVPVIHLSGASPLSALASSVRYPAALWPIRSLRRGETVSDWRDLPLVYDAADEDVAHRLGQLAARLSDRTYRLGDEQRSRLHLAAVFSNNFVTWFYELAHQLCAEKDIPFAALLAIIRNTALKQDGSRPALSQTGAAARGDRKTMANHLAGLKDHPELAELYRTLSRMIHDGTRDLGKP